MGLKILLADDEDLIVKAVEILISEVDPSIEIIGTANDGIKAWNSIFDKRPDGVLLDIKMPGLDGLQILKKIEENQLDTKVIILSAYRDFAYAQEALKYGAIDYLVKPLDIEKLRVALLRLNSICVHESRMQPSTSRYAFDTLMAGGNPADELFVEWDFFHGCTNKKIKVLLFQFKEPMSYENYRQYRIDKNKWLKYLRPLYINEYIWIMIIKDGAKGNPPSVTTLKSSFSGLNFCVGISDVHEHIAFYKAYQESWNAVQRFFYYPQNSEFYFTNMEHLSEQCGSLVRVLREKQFDEKWNLSMTDDVIGILSDWFSEIKKLRPFPLKVFAELKEMIVYVKSQIKFETYKLVKDLEESIDKLQTSHCLVSCNDLEEYIITCIREILNRDRDEQNTDRHRLIRKVQTYCERNFQQDITLDMVAKEVHLNKTWFCSLFKKETGKTFWEYLTDLRMKKAKLFLENTEEKINTISGLVGYKNASHFNHLFFEKYGVTPTEYRRRFYGGTHIKKE